MPLNVDIEIQLGDRTIAVSFDVADGETVALVGRNGAGKTTALEAVAGIADATGRVALDGRSLIDVPPERRGIGVAFQDALLFPKLSVLENVAFPLRAAGAGRDGARARALAVLRDLAPAVDPNARPATLSGGERQRVALARALAAEPKLLLLDEPFAAVDAEGKPELRTLLRRTLATFDGPRVLVTHDPVEAMTLADRLVLLEDGRVTQTGTPDQVRNAPATRYAAEFVGTNLFEGLLEPEDEGVGILRAGGGELTVVWPERMPLAAVADVRATLSPAEIALHTEEPHGSPRNVFRGAVEEVATVGGRARIRLRTAPPLVAELTTGSVDRLGIVPGRDVWASCKAVEIRLMVPGEEPDTL
jgi:molybdate transport system ATP-binding protein